MTVLNDNGAEARYRIEVEADNGRLLVTEGTAGNVAVEQRWDAPATITLNGARNMTQKYEDKEENTVNPEAVKNIEAPSSTWDNTDPEPEYPAKPTAVVMEGENPYVNSSELCLGQSFGVADLKGEQSDASYSLENYNSGVVILDVARDEKLLLNDEDRLKMAIRLLSVEPYGTRVADWSGNRFCTKDPEDKPVGDGAIASIISQLHATLINRKHAEAVEKYNKEHKAWSDRNDARKDAEAEKAEAAALHELTFRRMKAVNPSYAKRFTELEEEGRLADYYKMTYGANESDVRDDLREAGLTAVEELANLKAKETEVDAAARAEEDALDAIAYNVAVNVRRDLRGGSLARVKSIADITFPAERRRAITNCEALGVTAVKYAEVHGINFPVA